MKLIAKKAQLGRAFTALHLSLSSMTHDKGIAIALDL